MRTFFISLFAIFLALQTFAVSAAEVQYGVPAPTLFESQIQESQDGNFLITGVTFNDTVVDVYIDGVFNGKAEVANHESGVASFAYKPFLSLTEGEHNIYTVARSIDETVRSQQSATVLVTIPPIIAVPTGVSTEIDDSGKTRIVGNVVNGYEVEIFIEGRQFVSFIPPQSTGSVTSFWYSPGLPSGDYTVSIRSKSPEGVLSAFVDHVLTFGTSVTKEVADEAKVDTTNVKVVEDTTTDAMIDIENVVDPAKVLDELKKQDEVVIVNEQDSDTKVIINTTESKDEVVIDEDKAIEEIVVPAIEDDEVVIFGENNDELDSEINGGVSEEAMEGDAEDNNRKTGFVLLLIIVIILAIWYIREKQKSLRGEETSENTDQITMNEIKEKIQHVVEEAKQEKDNSSNDKKQNNHKKKKNKKRRR